MTDFSILLDLVAEAEPGPLERGQALVGRGVVAIQSATKSVVEARVQGTMAYLVTLRVDGTKRSWSCSCPAAADGSFCKHCVAVALEVSSDKSDMPDAGLSEADRIEAYVRSLDASALAEIVLDQVAVDQALAYRMLASATAASEEKIDLREWKKRVTTAFRGRGGFIDWRAAPDWARGVHEMLDTLEVLLAAGHANEVAALAEHAHHRAQTAVNRVDDSGGEITGIIGVIREIHFAAAEAGASTPKRLGKRLADLELAASLDTFHRSAIEYADVLGEDGLDAYLAVVEKAQAELSPGADRWGARFRVHHCLAAHAIATRDPDRLMEVHAGEEQLLPSDYVDIVELLMDQGRLDEAATWADQGLSTGSPHYLGPLRELRATLTRRAGGGDAAVEELYWDDFVRRPSGLTLRTLLANGELPAATRARVLQRLQSEIEAVRADLAENEVDNYFQSKGTSPAPTGSIGAKPRHVRPGRASAFGSSAIIDVLVALDEADRAWQVALEFGAHPKVWSDLAERRSADHPQDAIDWAVVAAAVEISHKDRKHYRRAVRHLRAATNLAESHDGHAAGPLSQRLEAGVQGLLEQHANKPSLVEEFAKAGWTR